MYHILFSSDEFIGVDGSYVDDLLRAGDNHFRSIVDKTLHRFYTGGNEMAPTTSAGIHISRTTDYTYTNDQLSYVNGLTQLRSDATFKELSFIRMRLAWISNTWLDLLYEISHLAQATQLRHDEQRKKTVRRINKALRNAQYKPGKISFLNLQSFNLRIV